MVRIETLKEKKVIGLRKTMSHTEDKTLELWQLFMTYSQELENRSNKDYVSMSVYDADFKPGDDFSKWAAVEVHSPMTEENELEYYELEGGLYAVITHKGPASTFHQTQNYMLNEYLPSSPYELDQREHFEILPFGYNPMDENATEELWLPIRLK